MPYSLISGILLTMFNYLSCASSSSFTASWTRAPIVVTAINCRTGYANFIKFTSSTELSLVRQLAQSTAAIWMKALLITPIIIITRELGHRWIKYSSLPAIPDAVAVVVAVVGMQINVVGHQQGNWDCFDLPRPPRVSGICCGGGLCRGPGQITTIITRTGLLLS